ncbi:MAG: amino acid ABC transporter permease [Planctomycetes bacterium]|nr:amino acid ABC transporter permease [Planctomycetota bacterium]
MRAAVVAAIVGAIVLAVSLVPAEVNWASAFERRDLFTRGLVTTAAISAGALVVGLALGTLAGLARASSSVALDQAAFTYVELVRGTPFLVQLYVLYFCVARAAHLYDAFGDAEPVLVGIAGLGLFSGAYVAEIVRAGVESIDRGQWEAARSLGLSHAQTLRHVIVPQAAARMLPPLTSEAVSLVKESSLLSVIGVGELTFHAKNLSAATYDSFAAYLPLAVLYLCVTLPLSWLTRRMERRLAPVAALPVARL